MSVVLKYRIYLLTNFALLCLSFIAYSQSEKYKARVSLQYVKIMDTENFINISAKYRNENGIEKASNLEFNVYTLEAIDSLVHLGKTKTNIEGMAKFMVTDNHFKNVDAETVLTFVVKIEGNEKFEDQESAISFSDANLLVDVRMIDSVHHISARLTDPSENPIPGQPLRVGLQRFYALHQIGEYSYDTDEDGSILVPIGEPMPGINGNLEFEVILSESDNYGTIKKVLSAPIGFPIVDESTFDQRTMWSPPDKTPLYLLIFPNLIIVGTWVPLLLLMFNLYRISKAKTN